MIRYRFGSNARRMFDEEAPTDVFVRPRAAIPDRTPAPHRDGLWDANDVARYLKVSRSWVYHRAEAGHLPLRRIGGLLRFDPASIMAFAQGDTVDAHSHRHPRAGRR
jgi:excisionase family DNA binding protein